MFSVYMALVDYFDHALIDLFKYDGQVFDDDFGFAFRMGSIESKHN